MSAVAQRDWSRVLDLHEAPFLDGFYLSGAVDFDQWMAVERVRFRARRRSRARPTHRMERGHWPSCRFAS